MRAKVEFKMLGKADSEVIVLSSESLEFGKTVDIILAANHLDYPMKVTVSPKEDSQDILKETTVFKVFGSHDEMKISGAKSDDCVTVTDRIGIIGWLRDMRDRYLRSVEKPSSIMSPKELPKDVPAADPLLVPMVPSYPPSEKEEFHPPLLTSSPKEEAEERKIVGLNLLGEVTAIHQGKHVTLHPGSGISVSSVNNTVYSTPSKNVGFGSYPLTKESIKSTAPSAVLGSKKVEIEKLGFGGVPDIPTPTKQKSDTQSNSANSSMTTNTAVAGSTIAPQSVNTTQVIGAAELKTSVKTSQVIGAADTKTIFKTPRKNEGFGSHALSPTFLKKNTPSATSSSKKEQSGFGGEPATPTANNHPAEVSGKKAIGAVPTTPARDFAPRIHATSSSKNEQSGFGGVPATPTANNHPTEVSGKKAIGALPTPPARDFAPRIQTPVKSDFIPSERIKYVIPPAERQENRQIIAAEMVRKNFLHSLSVPSYIHHRVSQEEYNVMATQDCVIVNNTKSISCAAFMLLCKYRGGKNIVYNVAIEWFSRHFLNGSPVVNMPDNHMQALSGVDSDRLSLLYRLSGVFYNFADIQQLFCFFCEDEQSHCSKDCVRVWTYDMRVELVGNLRCAGCLNPNCTIGNVKHTTFIKDACNDCGRLGGQYLHTKAMCNDTVYWSILRDKFNGLASLFWATMLWSDAELEECLGRIGAATVKPMKHIGH